MKAFVIGLPESYRGLSLEIQLSDLGFEVLRRNGVRVKQETSCDVDRDAARILMRRHMTDGEYGCALAHRAVHMEASETDEEWVAIFEDDATIVGDLIAVARRAEVTLGSRPTVVMLYCMADWSVVRRRWGRPCHEGGFLTASASPPTTTAYMANRAALRILLESQSPTVSYVADWHPKAFDRIRFVIDLPFTVVPAMESGSTLQTTRGELEQQLDRDRAVLGRRVGELIRRVSFSQYRRRPDIYGRPWVYFEHHFLRPARRTLGRRRDLTVARLVREIRQ